MAYVATTTFMANGEQIRRGQVLKDSEVKLWLNYQLLISCEYLRHVSN